MAAQTTYDVSVVIPLHNAVHQTVTCLESLVSARTAVRYEVVLVDNGSADETRLLLTQVDGDVQTVRNPVNLGAAVARNQGVEAAWGHYIAFLGPHVEVGPRWLEPLVECLDANDDIGVVGARLVYPDGTVRHAGYTLHSTPEGPLPTDEGRGKLIAPPTDGRRDVPAVSASAMLVRREVLEAAEGFDEGFWNGNEDADLCLRAGDLGWRVTLEPATTVVTLEPKRLEAPIASLMANNARFAERWSGRGAALMLRPAA